MSRLIDADELKSKIQKSNCNIEHLWKNIETSRDKYKFTKPIFEAMSYSEDVKHFEILGNVFDNPELLESEE